MFSRSLLFGILARVVLILSVALCWAALERSLRWPQYYLSSSPKTEMQRVFPQKTLGEMVEHLKAQDALFVDARGLPDYNFGHIPTAISVPIDAELPTTGLDQLKKETRPVIVYCDGSECSASKEVAARLSHAGVKTVYLFTGGMHDWSAAGMPLQQSN